MPTECTAERVHQHTKTRLAQLTTGLTKRQYPLHPAIAFHTRRSTRTFAPKHTKSQGSLGTVIGRFHAMLDEEHPKRRQG